MPDRSKAAPRVSEAPSAKGIPVICGMEDCDASAHLRFLNDPPYEAFRFDTEGWTVVEDREDGRTVFLCADCAREFEEEVAGEEEGDLEDDDEDEELDDEDDAP